MSSYPDGGTDPVAETMENVTRRQVELIHKSIVSGGCDGEFFFFISSGKKKKLKHLSGLWGYKFKRKKKKPARAVIFRVQSFIYIPFRSTAIALTISQS